MPEKKSKESKPESKRPKAARAPRPRTRKPAAKDAAQPELLPEVTAVETAPPAAAEKPRTRGGRGRGRGAGRKPEPERMPEVEQKQEVVAPPPPVEPVVPPTPKPAPDAWDAGDFAAGLDFDAPAPVITRARVIETPPPPAPVQRRPEPRRQPEPPRQPEPQQRQPEPQREAEFDEDLQPEQGYQPERQQQDDAELDGPEMGTEQLDPPTLGANGQPLLPGEEAPRRRRRRRGGRGRGRNRGQNGDGQQNGGAPANGAPGGMPQQGQRGPQQGQRGPQQDQQRRQQDQSRQQRDQQPRRGDQPRQGQGNQPPRHGDQQRPQQGRGPQRSDRPLPPAPQQGQRWDRQDRPQPAPRDRQERPEPTLPHVQEERPQGAPPEVQRRPQPSPLARGDVEFEPDALELEEPTKGPADRTMLINVAEADECRIAVLHQDRLEELFMERSSAESHVGNIYKGRVTNVEPSIQAAFVDFGLPKNGFLHISDLQPQYFPDHHGRLEEVGRKTPRRDRPPIQRCLRRGQEVIVQIIKEGIGTKGPTLTTYISIPGRYLVMMPGMNRLGVSRKIEDEDARRKMRAILDELELPKDMGFILRTAGLEKTKKDLQRDQVYLMRLWKVVANRIKNERAPCELYQESDLVIRTIRDIYSSDFGKIIVDDPNVAEKVRDFLSIAMPRSSAPVEDWTSPEPLFHKFGIEKEIELINARHVALPSGGSLVIDSTEALVAIDVNSGRFRELNDAEETAYRINIEAAEEIARQLRLRDLGGLILCDFIDMRFEKHRRGVEKAIRDALKKHKERAKCLRMSQFGIVEMTRQRMRPSIKRSIFQDCPHCRGSGLVKNAESMTLDILRLLRLAAHHKLVDSVEVRVAPTVAFQLQNRKRNSLHLMEQETGRKIIIRGDSNLGMDQYAFECLDGRGGTVHVIDPPEQPRSPAEMRGKRHQPPVEARHEVEESFEETVD
jgi:Rne/Rng family ribonuclease